MTDRDDRREYRRISLETEVRIEFPDMAELVSTMSSDLSLGGMFIRSASPHPAGTRFRFELNVGGHVSFISGLAEVVWVRAAGGAAGTEPGMGVRFIDLDEISRAIIFRIVDRYIQVADGTPFDIEAGP